MWTCSGGSSNSQPTHHVPTKMKSGLAGIERVTLARATDGPWAAGCSSIRTVAACNRSGFNGNAANRAYPCPLGAALQRWHGLQVLLVDYRDGGLVLATT